MVQMIAAGSRRRQDGRVGNGRYVIAVHGSAQDCPENRKKQLLRAGGACNGRSDGNQDCHSSPGGSGRKSQESRHNHNHGRKQEGRESGIGNGISHMGSRIQVIPAAHAADGPGKNQNGKGRNHRLDSLRNAPHKVYKGQHTSGNVEDKGGHQGQKASEHQGKSRVALTERLQKRGPGESAACIYHSQHRADNQGHNGDDQIVNLAL